MWSEPAITDKWLTSGRPWYALDYTQTMEMACHHLWIWLLFLKVKKEVTFESYILNGDGSIVHVNAEGQL